MNLKRVLCFDLEMCCWEAAKTNTGEIIEIGITEVDNTSLTITRSVQYYVKPKIDKISEYCLELTGISQETIDKQGRPLNEVLSTWKKQLGFKNKILLAWGRDDKTIIEECRKKNIEFNFGEYINLADMFRLLHGTNRISQIEAMKIYGLDFEGRQHGAKVDSYNLARLYIKMCEELRNKQ